MNNNITINIRKILIKKIYYLTSRVINHNDSDNQKILFNKKTPSFKKERRFLFN